MVRLPEKSRTSKKIQGQAKIRGCERSTHNTEIGNIKGSGKVRGWKKKIMAQHQRTTHFFFSKNTPDTLDIDQEIA